MKNSEISNNSSSIDIFNNTTHLTDISEFTESINLEVSASEILFRSMSNVITIHEDKNTLYNSLSELKTENEELEINYKLVIK